MFARVLHRAGSSTVSRSAWMKTSSAPKVHAQRAQKRFFNLHEYQSKGLMDKYGVNTQRWRLASNPEEALKAAEELQAKEYVVKAQVHAGGRGKGHFIESGLQGGVKIVSTGAEVSEVCKGMLGSHLVTKQTPAEGLLCDKVMVAESLTFSAEHEKYFAILMDRVYDGPVFVGSPQGGMDIEAVAAETPDLIYKVPIDIMKGPQADQTKALAEKLGFKGDAIPSAQAQMVALYNMFLATDSTQVEINPLVQASDGKVYAVDAKINFDDNAEYRQKEVFAFRDPADEDPREVEAAKHDLNYIAMEGNIGCLVNGAGLAMATMDIIHKYDGSPANFLDVGGSADENQVKEAFKILQNDKNVKAILVNIFGGIMKCDVIAQGIINAMAEIKLDMPLVVRLAGTNYDLAKKMLEDSGLPIITATDLDDAAQKATANL
eukprot:TRINITY_DN3961_c0_g4_i1.p1 TRINITY_DN3961_c0_g4~~TRINITY_DN3961_c0_g4_i1.p1  ORF type:complete len:443 (-),score=135.76 TRINITY_DN3961_c0_g4_i1:123-1421(-)